MNVNIVPYIFLAVELMVIITGLIFAWRRREPMISVGVNMVVVIINFLIAMGLYLVTLCN